MQVEGLRPLVQGILSASGVDLQTISAKRVRKQLLQLDPSLSEVWIRDNKEPIDKLIATVFEEVATANAERADSPEVNGKRKHEEIEDNPQSSPEKPTNALKPIAALAAPRPPPVSLPKKIESSTSKDEELARKLAAELNTPRTRSGGTEKKPVKKTKAKKSAAHVGSDEDGEEPPKKKAKGGFQKEFALSEPLAALMGTSKMSRPQVVKKIWEHIKGNSLQDPSNRKEIICDDLMKAIFNVDRIDMFQMNKHLGNHLYEAHES